MPAREHGTPEWRRKMKPDPKVEDISMKTDDATAISLPFFLPAISPWHIDVCCSLMLDDSSLDHLGTCRPFDIDALAWAIQNGLSHSCIERYLKQQVPSTLTEELCSPVLRGSADSTFPILFFAVEKNDPEMIRMLIQAGADPMATTQHPKIPLLAYCVINAEYGIIDSNDCLSALLAMGASPYSLPVDLWCDYIKTPTKIGPKLSEADMREYGWCTREVRAALCNNFNLLQRYHCSVASLLPSKTPRQKQVAKAFNLMPLFEIPHHIIGQRLAAKLVQEWLTSHALHHVNTPLVLMFTGPSGHGKTELAKQMGELLSLPFLKVDCTGLKFESDLFGPRAPYAGHLGGSQLNNFLS
ncbi:MAG: hypothetical protein Q9174_005828, partial [Haloplaca sp. 1 TL-2023]